MKQLTINIRNEVAEVLLYDVIGADDFFGGGISAKTFRDQVKGIKAKALNLRINSPGGSVFEASAMMAALDEFKGRVEVDIDGIAASAASVVAMAGDEIRMATNAMIMIHRPYAAVIGPADDMRAMAEVLDKTTGQLLDTYERHSKAGRDQLKAWMDAETWFTPEEAIAAGLAHAVTETRQIAACAGLKEMAEKLHYKHIPAAVLKANDGEAQRLAEETRKRREIAARL